MTIYLVIWQIEGAPKKQDTLLRYTGAMLQELPLLLLSANPTQPDLTCPSHQGYDTKRTRTQVWGPNTNQTRHSISVAYTAPPNRTLSVKEVARVARFHVPFMVTLRKAGLEVEFHFGVYRSCQVYDKKHEFVEYPVFKGPPVDDTPSAISLNCG